MNGHAHGVTLTHQEAENLRHRLYVAHLRLLSLREHLGPVHGEIIERLRQDAEDLDVVVHAAIKAGEKAGTVMTAEQAARIDALDQVDYPEPEGPPRWAGG